MNILCGEYDHDVHDVLDVLALPVWLCATIPIHESLHEVPGAVTIVANVCFKEEVEKHWCSLTVNINIVEDCPVAHFPCGL